MKIIFKRAVMGFMLLLFNGHAMAEIMNITLEFKPSAANPNNNKFKNTTPVSGYCARYPALCGEYFSVMSNLRVDEREFLKSSQTSDRRYWTYQGVDAQYKIVSLRHNTSGETRDVKFRINLLSMRYNFPSAGINMNSAGAYPPAGCGAATGSGSATTYTYAWKHHEGNRVCAKALGESSTTPMSAAVREISFGYEIISPEPLKMENGLWEGSVSYNVGNHQQIDVGVGNYNDNVLTFNITATVEHHFDIQRPPGSSNVVLSPPAGWDKFINYGQLPSRLIRDVPLWVTSSGPFNVSLICEYYTGSQCGIASTLDGTIVPIRIGLTIPGVESDGSPVKNIELDNRSPQSMKSVLYNNMQLSHLNFSAESEAVQAMARQRGTRWQGSATIVFDANL